MSIYDLIYFILMNRNNESRIRPDNEPDRSNQPQPSDHQNSSTSNQSTDSRPQNSPEQSTASNEARNPQSSSSSSADSSASSNDANRTTDRSFVRGINDLLRLTAQRLRGDSTRTGTTGASGATSPGSGVGTGTGAGTDENGAIIITINYVFSDENNPNDPNRSGSLVLTLPNNASNRDPETLDEFIRLATQMAYTTIVGGVPKEKKGLTVDKFKSFPVKNVNEISETDCAICLDPLADKESDEPRPKRRRLNEQLEFVSGTTGANGTGENSGNSGTGANHNDATVAYLKDSNILFDHVPVELPCHHIFGQLCLAEWLKAQVTCPMCREVVEKEDNDGDTTTSANTTNTTSDSEDPSMGQRFGLLNTSYEGPSLRVLTRTGLENFRGLMGATPIIRRRVPLATSTTRAEAAEDNSAPDAGSGDSTGSIDQGEVISRISNYLNSSFPQPLFPAGVASRRTGNGVSTTTTGDSTAPLARTPPSNVQRIPIIMSNRQAGEPSQSQRDAATEEVLDYLNLRSLTDDPPATGTPSTAANSAATGTNDTGNTGATATTGGPTAPAATDSLADEAT